MKRKQSQPAAVVAPQIPAGVSPLLQATVLILITVAAYGRAVQAGYIWDDADYVYENANLQSLAGLRDTWLVPKSLPQYYPLVHTSYWLEYQLWGLMPAGYHAVNILLHAANGVLLWRVLLRLQVPGAWFAAAVFVLHPVHVESVAWITERKNTLSGLFYLAAAYFFLRAKLDLSERPWIAFLSAYLCFVAAMLCKTVAATLPAALLVVLWWKNGKLTWRDMLATVPMFAVGVPLGMHTAWLERYHVGASGPEWSYTLLERMLIAGRAVWFYAGKLVWPVNLTFIYPKWNIDPEQWWQWLFPAAAAGVLFVAWRFRQQMGRHWLAGLLFFGGTLFPALGFFNVYPMRYSFVADHFQYLASIGLIALFAGSAATWHSRQPARRWPIVAAGLLLGLLGSLTWLQTRSYRDVFTLWGDTLAKNPSCEMARTNLGLELHDSGRPEEALVQFRAALSLAPQDPIPHNNVAMALMTLERLEEAETHLNAALALAPDYAEARSNLAVLRQRQGRWSEAESEFRRGLELMPENFLVRYNLASLLHERKDFSSARREYLCVLETAPGYVPARLNLAILLLETNDFAAAIDHLERLLQQNPKLTQAQMLLQKARQGAPRSPAANHHEQ